MALDLANRVALGGKPAALRDSEEIRRVYLGG